MGLALSTSWNAFRYTKAKALISEIKNLGFEEIELSFNLTAAIVKEIEIMVRKARIRVVSAHNFCPIPEGPKRKDALPDCYSMASLDRSQREQALKYTKRTIDTAAALGAKAVVLHCGRVEIPDRTKSLIELYHKNKRCRPALQKLKKAAESQRKSRAKPFFENTLKSLDALNRYAKNRKISLGIENRFYYREIPTFEEFGIIFKKFRGSNIFYWHDTGHAQVMENIGFAEHKAYLDCYAKYMLGMHLHNLKGCLDHQSPVNGDFNFNRLTPYIKKGAIKVIEAHHQAKAQELVKSKRFLEKIWHGKV